MNNIKIYGGEPQWTTSAEEGTRRFWQNIFGGEVTLYLSQVTGKWEMKWMNILISEWEKTSTIDGNSFIDLKTPGPGQWAVLLLPSE